MLADEAFISKWQQPNTAHFKDYIADDMANSRIDSSVWQGKAGQGARSVYLSVLQGRGQGRAGSKR